MAAQCYRGHSCECKIGRNIDRYHLNDLNQELVHHRKEKELSLRDLASVVNHRILEAAIEDTSAGILEEELYGALEHDDAVATIYGALTDEEVSPDRRARVRTRLEQAGVNLDTVEDHWVTHTTLRKHLQDCLGIDTSSESTIGTDNARSTIEWIQTRMRAIVDRTFERLASTEKLHVGQLDITISIRVTCTDCGTTYNPTKLISRGSCDCYLDAEDP